MCDEINLFLFPQMSDELSSHSVKERDPALASPCLEASTKANAPWSPKFDLEALLIGEPWFRVFPLRLWVNSCPSARQDEFLGDGFFSLLTQKDCWLCQTPCCFEVRKAWVSLEDEVIPSPVLVWAEFIGRFCKDAKTGREKSILREQVMKRYQMSRVKYLWIEPNSILWMEQV